jgi:hypothetical protein
MDTFVRGCKGLALKDLASFFGFVVGLENEWGQFSFSELAEVRNPFGRSIERDWDFPYTEPKLRPSRIAAIVVSTYVGETQRLIVLKAWFFTAFADMTINLRRLWRSRV